MSDITGCNAQPLNPRFLSKNGVCLDYSNDSAVKYYAKEFDIAEPKDLQEAADAIHKVRSLAAVQRHKELDDPLRQAEEWARKEYRKVREENGGRDAVKPGSEMPCSTIGSTPREPRGFRK